VAGPGVLVDERDAVGREEAHGVGRAETVAERRFLDDEEGPGGDGRTGGQDRDVVVGAVLDDPAAQVDGRGRGVEEFDPVAGRSAVRLDLVDAHAGTHDRGARVGGAARGSRGQGECARAVGAAAVGGGGVGGPGVAVDEGRAVGGEEAGRVGSTQSEGHLGVANGEEAARGDGAAGGEDVGVGVVVVAQDEARGIHGGRADVGEFDPVARGAARGFDLVDAHDVGGVDDAGVRGALGRRGREGEGTGAVGAAAVGGGGVSGPGVAVDERGAVGREESGRVGLAQAVAHGRLVEDEECSGGEDGSRGQRVGAGVGVVLDDPARDVDGRRADVGEFDPVGGRGIRFDLIDADGGGGIGCDRGGRCIGSTGRGGERGRGEQGGGDRQGERERTPRGPRK
jgi:hypothetical protein